MFGKRSTASDLLLDRPAKVAEASAKTTVSDLFADVAQVVSGRKELKKARKKGLELGGLLGRLRSRPKAAKSRTKNAG